MAIEPIEGLSFTKDWTNPDDFPTFEGNEQQVRADTQYLYNEIRNYLNNYVKETVNQLIDAVAELVAVSVPDNSITTAKLVNASVTAQKLAAAAVGTGNVQDGAVTFQKLDPATVTPNALGCAAQNHTHALAAVTGLTDALNSMTAAINQAIAHVNVRSGNPHGVTRAMLGAEAAGAAAAVQAVVTEHTDNSTIHVTAADKSEWSGKQDELTEEKKRRVFYGDVSAEQYYEDHELEPELGDIYIKLPASGTVIT